MLSQRKLQFCRSIVHNVQRLKNSWRALDIKIQTLEQLLQAKVCRQYFSCVVSLIVSYALQRYFYRAMHVVLARYCYRKLITRIISLGSVRPSVRDVDVSWAYRLD